MTNRMEWQPIETAKRFTLVFEGDIRKIDGFIGHVDTPFGRPVASGLGNAFDQCAASEARISELEAEVDRLKADLVRASKEKVSAQLSLADEVHRRQMAECQLSVHFARSTAMNKGGE